MFVQLSPFRWGRRNVNQNLNPRNYRPQTKLREGNVFTPVCDSVHKGGGCNPTCITGHMGRHPLGRHPPCSCMVNERVVHILLECILVCTKGLFTRCDRDYDLLSKRECIPVGSVLTARCPYLGGGGWVPGAGGGTWSRGCTWSRGGAPGPRGVYLVLEGGSARYTLPGPDQVHPPDQTRYPPPGPDQVLPPVNRITDRCKNITLAQLRCGR